MRPDPVYNRFNAMKLLAYSDRLRRIADGEYPFPIDWHVYPSNICNHTCSWCMFRQNGEQENFPNLLPATLLFKAVDEAVDTGAKLMHFSGGGEPLIHQALPLVMEAARERKLAVALSTNGSLLTPEVASLVDYLRISLNAGSEEQHAKTNHSDDKHRDWERILENIAKAVPCKRGDIGLAFAVDHDNWADIYKFCDVAAKLKVDFVHIRPSFWYDQELDKKTRAAMPLAFQQCEQAKADFGDKVQIFALTDKFDGYWTPRTYTKCKAVLTGVCLRATGDFAVCQDRMDLVFGKNPSWAGGASFREVWNSAEHRTLVASIVSPGPLDACPRCVWNTRNRVIQEVFENDAMRLAMV